MTEDQLHRLYEQLAEYRDWLEDEPMRLGLQDALLVVLSNVVSDELEMRSAANQ